MFFYLVFFSIIFILAFFVKNKWSDGLIVVLLLFFSMFRGMNVGIDTAHYLADFSQRELDLSSFSVYSSEFIFIGFERLCIALNLSTQYVIYFFSIITFYFLVKSSQRFNVSVSLVCLFYVLFDYYTLSLNIARQFAAASILLYAYSYLQYIDRRRFCFFLFVILASGFHIVSFVFIVLYFVRYINITPNNKWFFVVFCFAFYIFCFIWVNKLMQPIINLLSIYNQYSDYLSQTEEMQVTSSTILFNTCIFLINIIVFVQLQKRGANKNLINLFLVSILIYTLFINLYGNFGRIKYSIGIINVVCYAYFFDRNRFSRNKLVMITAIMIVYGYILIYGLSVNSYGQIPYYLNFSFLQ